MVSASDLKEFIPGHSFLKHGDDQNPGGPDGSGFGRGKPTGEKPANEIVKMIKTSNNPPRNAAILSLQDDLAPGGPSSGWRTVKR